VGVTEVTVTDRAGYRPGPGRSRRRDRCPWHASGFLTVGVAQRAQLLPLGRLGKRLAAEHVDVRVHQRRQPNGRGNPGWRPSVPTIGGRR
jgi:hypothetical protein